VAIPPQLKLCSPDRKTRFVPDGKKHLDLVAGFVDRDALPGKR